MPTLTGQSIDRYQISTLLDEDQLGAIYKAYDPKFDRTVTIYFVNAQVAKQMAPSWSSTNWVEI